jgi:hypothetical protein
MKSHSAIVLRGLALFAFGLCTLDLVLLVFFPRHGSGQAGQLSLFCAPSHIPPGESWVLLGSKEDIPADLEVAPLAGGVSVLELQKLSPKALAVRLQALAGAQGKLLRVNSKSSNSEVFPELYLGQKVPPSTSDANFGEEDFIGGKLIVGGKYFMYAYLEAGDVPLGALRIHNRATGKWQCNEILEEKIRKANEPPVAVGPAFGAVDVRETLPDTDGNGIPDFEEPPEVKPPRPDEIGVELSPGENTLDLVTVDEAGNASWRTVDVYTTHSGQEGF